MSDLLFPKDQIAVLEKQIDRLRKEGDDRMNSNHTLWRAGLAGIGALILLKESLDLSRFVVLVPLLCMVFAAHWLNQILMLYRAGDAMASCESKINQLAGTPLLDHEIKLTGSRKSMLEQRRSLMLGAAVLATAVYWLAIWQVQPYATAKAALLLWQVGLGTAALANVVAAVNLRRLLTFGWPSLATAQSAA